MLGIPAPGIAPKKKLDFPVHLCYTIISVGLHHLNNPF
jgi:hypothetical protein